MHQMKSGRNDVLPIWIGGVMVGILGLGFLLLAVNDSVNLKTLKEYQTILAGLLALIGALTTVIFIRRQISATQKQHEELIKRSSVAARSVLPMVLSELHSYATNCITIALEMAERRPVKMAYVRPTDAVFEAFSEAIKFAPKPQQIEMWELMTELQIQVSRFSDALQNYTPQSAGAVLYSNGKKTGDGNITSFDPILNAESLLYRVTELYSYARAPSVAGRSGGIPSSRIERFRGAFLRQPIDIDAWPNLLRVATERFEREAR